MQDDNLTTELVRVPGLYRSWELPQVLRLHEAFQIEGAGAHEDGTPLLAIYSTDQNQFERVLAEIWTPGPTDPSRPSGTISEPRE
jgi:hypothetical protein